MGVKINIYYIDLTDVETTILEDHLESINNEMYLVVPEDVHELWALLFELVKSESKRMFDLILLAHIRAALYRNDPAANRIARTLHLGE